MKYIIGFVLLGLVTYAGLFFLVTGLNAAAKNTSVPVNFNNITAPSGFTPGAVEGTITQTVGRLNKGIVTERDFLGVVFGDSITEYFYVIPAGAVLDELDDQQYMALRVSGEEKTAILDEITFTFPKQPSELSDTPGLEFSGYISEMDDELFAEMQQFLYNHEKLVGIEDMWEMKNVKYFNNHICRYTLTIRSGENDYGLPIIIGAVVSAVGVGGIALLIVGKVRGRGGY